MISGYIPLTAQSVTHPPSTILISPNEVESGDNDDKILVCQGGALCWLTFDELIDALASHLSPLKASSVTAALSGTFLRKRATGDLGFTGLVDVSEFMVGSPSQVVLFTDPGLYTLQGGFFQSAQNIATGIPTAFTPEITTMNINDVQKALTVPANAYISANIAAPDGTSDFTIGWFARYPNGLSDHAFVSNRDPTYGNNTSLTSGHFGSYHRITVTSPGANSSVNFPRIVGLDELFVFFAVFNSVTRRYSLYYGLGTTGTIVGPATLLQNDQHTVPLPVEPFRLCDGWDYAAEPNPTTLHGFGVWNSSLTSSQMDVMRNYIIARTA